MQARPSKVGAAEFSLVQVEAIERKEAELGGVVSREHQVHGGFFAATRSIRRADCLRRIESAMSKEYYDVSAPVPRVWLPSEAFASVPVPPLALALGGGGRFETSGVVGSVQAAGARQAPPFGTRAVEHVVAACPHDATLVHSLLESAGDVQSAERFRTRDLLDDEQYFDPHIVCAFPELRSEFSLAPVLAAK